MVLVKSSSVSWWPDFGEKTYVARVGRLQVLVKSSSLSWLTDSGERT